MSTGRPLWLSLLKKNVVITTDRPEITSAVYRGCNAKYQTNTKKTWVSIFDKTRFIDDYFRSCRHLLGSPWQGDYINMQQNSYTYKSKKSDGTCD